VHGPHAPRGALGVGARPEGDEAQDPCGPAQALIGLVQRAGVREEALECHRVGGLHQQRPGPGQADDLLADDAPQHGVVGEEVIGHRHRHRHRWDTYG
jgi:hypothetical protein